MLTEMLAQSGQRLLGETPPEGKAYWSERFWDREEIENHPKVGEHYRRQKTTLREYLAEHGRDADRVLEFACGTGELTRLAAEAAPTADIVAVDISEHALEQARERVPSDRVSFRRGDFWEDGDLGRADVVVCVDAIHHLGSVPVVLRRLREYVRPGGVLIGNVSTSDHWSDFQRDRYGTPASFLRTLGFFATAVLIRVSRGRLRTSSYRTQLVTSRRARRILEETFDDVVRFSGERYLTAFACRVGDAR